MACSRCGKKKSNPGRVVDLAIDSDIKDETVVIDPVLYKVQSRMFMTVDVSSQEQVRFLPGERVRVVGTLLSNILRADPLLFIFLVGEEKSSFLKTHPTLQGQI